MRYGTSQHGYMLFLATFVVSTFLLCVPSNANPPYSFTANSLQDVRRLCNAVSEKLISSSGKPVHELLLQAGAGVTESDSIEQIKEKIQKYWLTNREKLTCVQLGFSITNGNIVKLAIERNNREAMANFTTRWNLDMNFVDHVDGLTPLDFVEREIASNENSNLIVPWQRYRVLLLRHGARRKNDI